MALVPSFDAAEVGLLVSAVEEALKNLRAANERLGGNDPGMIDAGRRYALLLQKLQAVTSATSASQ